MNTDESRTALMDWISDRRKNRLAFGTFDCCTLCADYLTAMHGKPDLMAEFRETYQSHAGAMATLDKHGGMKRLVEERLGEMQPMSACEAGAIVYGDFGEGPALGICCGHNIAAVGVRGLVFMPLSRGKGCWPL